jgi:hypothetical protein
MTSKIEKNFSNFTKIQACTSGVEILELAKEESLKTLGVVSDAYMAGMLSQHVAIANRNREKVESLEWWIHQDKAVTEMETIYDESGIAIGECALLKDQAE